MTKHTLEPVELSALDNGYSHIVGVDEAGRGCLAGPVTLGFAKYSSPFLRSPVPAGLAGLRDSKKLKPHRREEYFEMIREYAEFSATISLSSRVIDRMGINPAVEYAVIRGVWRMIKVGIPVDLVLMDGNYRLAAFQEAYPHIPVRSYVGGDDRIFSIASGSILAKVTRDRRMQKYESLYPGYGFDRHMGYGTAFHKQAIEENGPVPIHRRSYRW